jgi:hypothetical protein
MFCNKLPSGTNNMWIIIDCNWQSGSTDLNLSDHFSFPVIFFVPTVTVEYKFDSMI